MRHRGSALVALDGQRGNRVLILIDRQRALGAIVIGRAGMDLYPLPDGTKIEGASEFKSDVGGSAANIAVALARQGVSAALLSPLADDPVGRFVRGALAGFGVDTNHCRSVGGGRRNSLALAETRANDCDVVIYRNGAADLQLERADIARDFIARAAVLIVTGTALAAEPSRSAAMEALAVARTTATFTILDVDHRRYSWSSDEEAGSVYAQAALRCDAVVGNDDEFAIIAGGAGRALGVAAEFVGRGCSFVIVTKGGRGSVTITAEATFETGVFPVQPLKPFGAGDAFLGGLVAALLQGHSLQVSLVRGSASAAHVVARRGCASAMPTGAEVEALCSAFT